MIKEEDLQKFLELYHIAVGSQDSENCAGLSELLCGEDFYGGELWWFATSLEIYCLFYDLPLKPVQVIKHISREMHSDRCIGFHDKAPWIQAVRSVLKRTEIQDEPSPNWRNLQVAMACARLNKKGYQFEFSSYGAKLKRKSNSELVLKIRSLVKLLGTRKVISNVLSEMRSCRRFHDEIWLFGNFVEQVWSNKEPTLPFGWLMGLAIKNPSNGNTLRRPNNVWTQIVQLSTDYAAHFNCERYSTYEYLQIDPFSVPDAVMRSLLWDTTFSVSQVPKIAVQNLINAVKYIIPRKDSPADLYGLLDEVADFVKVLNPEYMSVFKELDLKKRFPAITELCVSKKLQCTDLRSLPTDTVGWEMASPLFYAGDKQQMIAMPTSICCAALCPLVISKVRGAFKSNTRLIADIYERAVEQTTMKGVTRVERGTKYSVGKINYDLDVIGEAGGNVFISEVKSKVLTSKAKSMEMMKFYEDYGQAYIKMLGQLAGRELHLREGEVDSYLLEGSLSAGRVIKLAVSPTSFGPITSRTMTTGIVNALASMKLAATEEIDDHHSVVGDFNKELDKLYHNLKLVAPLREQKSDLQSYLHGVYWLDLGQLSYLLSRAPNVFEALRPLSATTFCTNDLWSEIAFAERTGLTKRCWSDLRVS
ncbi:hypothetical protein [Thalassospira povalilytica]|uniref:Uncharacterized protein n=1 Tax=Thalassospira povalilytica TaxID=732237 RepID=A0ABX4R4U7_9PROT|nr:hypothetical protein [Thalassospira povalilytica]PKR48125.1 hypothetical protein CU041_15480 [Thalassospira povalilytica]